MQQHTWEDPLEHHLLWSERSAHIMCQVGVEQCLLWCEVSARRREPDDLYDILAHEIGQSWRDWSSICLHIDRTPYALITAHPPREGSTA
jgi:hypothetical protein